MLQEEAVEKKTPEPAKPAGEKKESTDSPEEPAGEIKEPVPQPPKPAVPEPDDKGKKDDRQEAGDVQEEKPKAPWEGPVGETIRLRLAQQAANEEIKRVFDRLQAKMNKYRSSYAHYDAIRLEDPSAKPPAALNFEELAEEYGLGNHATRLMSQLEAEGIDIGRSYIDVGSSDIARKWSLRFLRYAYDEGWPLHLAAKSEDVLGNHYLFWKVQDAKEEVPKFEDSGVREQVLAAWKMVQARKLALGEAEHLRDLALKSRKPLKEAFVDRPDILDKLVLTTPFSWLTRGLVPVETSLAPPRISSVTGVQMPGPDFMRTVFDLQKDQVGVAMNVPQTIAYVLRVIEFNKSDVVLWTEFTADPYMTYAAAAFDDQRQLFEAWREGLKIEAGLQWKRKADHRWPE